MSRDIERAHELHPVRETSGSKPSDSNANLFPGDVVADKHKPFDDYHSDSDRDAMDMARMGRRQQLRRNFRSLSVLGLATTTMSTWVAFLFTVFFSLLNGGYAGTIWVAVASWFCIMSVVLSLAELASMAPTSGGQYHWVSEFAPAAHQKLLSYLVGWLAALAWQALVATTAYAFAGLNLQLAALYYPDFVPQPYQTSLSMIAIGVLATLFNTFGAKKLPLIEGIIIFVYIFGFFAINIPLWVLGPKTSASQVFTSFSSSGGWPSIGSACYVGSLSVTASFAGSDAAAHLAEEVRDASRSVPRMMVATVLLNGFVGIVTLITFLFCITDLEAVLNSSSSFVFVDVFYAATGSLTGTTAMAILPSILTACTVLGAVAAASRQSWALSRDNALPFSGWFQTVVTLGTPIPLNSILFSLSILVILALINIGSTTAFNSITGLLSSASAFSYVLSIGCILHRRLSGAPLPPCRFSLGKFGVPINAFAVLYTTIAAVATFFPLTLPVTAETMNWSIVMFAGVMGIATIDYIFRGRHKFIPPVKRVHKA